jgi:CHRD domain
MRMNILKLSAASALALTAGAMGASLVLSTAAADDGGRPIVVKMTGAEEVPPNTLGSTGQASFTVNPGQMEVCYELAVQGIATTVTAAHIHRGAAGANGPALIHLAAPVSGSSKGCTKVLNPSANPQVPIGRDLAKELIQYPERFYVNVHSQARPGGQVRAQLFKSQGGPKLVRNPFFKDEGD